MSVAHFCTGNPCVACGRSFTYFPPVFIGVPITNTSTYSTAIHRPNVKHAVHGDHWWMRCSCGASRWASRWDLAMEYALAHVAKGAQS